MSLRARLSHGWLAVCHTSISVPYNSHPLEIEHTLTYTFIAVPGQVLTQVDHVITVATRGQTTLFKASEVLEQSMQAYRYARFASRDDFNLKRKTGQLLNEYDNTLKAMIKCRLDSQLDEASNKEEECTRTLGKL